METEKEVNPTTEFRREEDRVVARSAVFKKELGLTDLALTQVLFIIGLPWIGVAAKQGPSHVVLWLVAMLLFYIPSAQVVVYLNRILPLEGGLYQWAKLGGGELLGFLVAWNLWLFALMTLSLFGKMGFGALGGFEYVAIHAGECRDPTRTITRSVLLAAPVIAGMFILGTSSVLALVPQGQIDLIAPIPQVLHEGF